MSVLVASSDLKARRASVAGSLRALADSLAADLEPVLGRDLFIPREKARMTRRGGRCEADGVLLEFDPFAPRAHRCPQCGRVYDDDAHYRWWIMGYQLWLAERAVHAAALYGLRGDARHRAFAVAVLAGYAERYLEYPNRDNVLGPTRPFFSTYLESIWLLQLIVALDLLESSAVPDAGAAERRETVALGGRVRDRVVEPSAALIAGFDEGLSNRQVWNNAALLAASRLLHGTPDERPLAGPSGLLSHLARGLLADGTWYEGENYHLFAHRGLWYGVTIAALAGAAIDAALIARFDEAFATPFATALPDFTFPARRDSQYGVSLRQWRFAELAELGLVRQPGDARLVGALSTLYDGSVPRRDTGRWRSTAEAERNATGSGLDRSDLGWRSLLFALPQLPPLTAWAPRSTLLESQGFAVLRRDRGALYAALDYGHSGEGHGHPDRLNLIIAHGSDRWLDDVGTGSYVDPSLHWYRSTLAHNAPLVNGRSQERVHGARSAYEDRGGAGWVRASVDGVAPGVRFERSLVVMPDYLVDELTWHADRDVTVDLPFHVDGELEGVGTWVRGSPEGGAAPEDGFAYLTSAETATGQGDVTLHAQRGSHFADVHVTVDAPHAWWRAVAFGPPGERTRRFYFVRARGQRGGVASVWDLRASVLAVRRFDGVMTIDLADGSRHEHHGDADGWHVTLATGGARSSIDLAGCVPRVARDAQARTPAPPRLFVIPRVGARSAERGRARKSPDALIFELGEAHYRRSELAWTEAGRPTATVSIAADDDSVVIAVDVRKPDTLFTPASDWNELDNEHPDTNSDGVQLHLVVPPTAESGETPRTFAWLMVPEPGGERVRVTGRSTSGPPVDLVASWARTPDGYALRCVLPRAALGDRTQPFLLDVIVNEAAPGRERRQGQLVLGGADGEFVYLRGDRQAAGRHLAFIIADA